MTKKLTLVCSGGAPSPRGAELARHPGAIPVPSVPALRAALHARGRDVGCVLLDLDVETHQLLELIAMLPMSFDGDVVLVRGDKGFIGAASSGGGRQRTFYTLEGADFETYLAGHLPPTGPIVTSLAPAPRLRPVPPEVLPLAQVLAPTVAVPNATHLLLIADDDRLTRTFVARIARERGCAIVLAASGLQTIRLATSLKPDTIVLDGLMPEMHGFEVARYIRLVAPDYRPRIVLMTAIYKSSKYQNEAKLKYGVDDYLVKPLSEQHIEAALRLPLVARSAAAN